MALISALRQYQSNVISSPYTSPARAGKVAPLDLRAPSTGTEQTQVSKAGDTLKVSGTAATRAEVQAANSRSQTVQAGLTTASAVNESLQKTSDVLGRMTNIVDALRNDQNLTASTREGLRKDFTELAGRLDDLAQSETFAGHKVLDGRFKVSFSIGEDQHAIIDVTLPNGKSFDVSGLGLEGVTSFMNATAAQAGSRVGNLQLPAGSEKGLEVAASAVAQVRQGVGEAAQSLLGALNGPDAPFGAPIAGATAMAQQLAAASRAAILANPAQALYAQANNATSAVSRLLAG